MTAPTTTHSPTAAKMTATTASFSITFEFPTVTDAREFAASLPKSLRAIGYPAGQLDNSVRGGACIQADLRPNGTTGAVNETGIKRYRAAMKALAARGIEVEYRALYTNSFPTRDDFEAAL